MGISPDAALRIQRRDAESAAIRTYAPADHEATIKDATQSRSLELLTTEGLDIQVLIYDIANNTVPPA